MNSDLQSTVQSYSVLDMFGNEIETRSNKMAPIDSKIVVKCKNGSFMTDGKSIISTSVCQSTVPFNRIGAHTAWLPPIESCYVNNCK